MGLAQFLSRHFFTRKVTARAVVEVSSCQQTRFEVVDADADADASDVVDMDGYVFKKHDECTNLLVARSAPLADGTRHEMEEMQAEQHEKHALLEPVGVPTTIPLPKSIPIPRYVL